MPSLHHAVQPGTTQTFKQDATPAPFTVPTLPPAGWLISVNYFLYVTANVPWALNPSIEIPFVFGNVFFREEW